MKHGLPNLRNGAPWEWSRPQQRQPHSRRTINSLSEVDLLGLALSDIRWLTGTGVAISNGVGREKSYTYRSGVMTDIGDIEIGVWRQLAEYFARFYNELPLVDALTEWKKAHNYTNEPPSELRLGALDLYACRIFDNPRWVDFIPFNRKYRPEALETARLVTVITDCCKIPGQITQEQLDSEYHNSIPCPHCGRWSLYAVCGTQRLEEL